MANRFKKEKENKDYLKFGNKYKKENNFSPYTPGIVYDNNNNSEVENTENVDEETKKQQIISQVTDYALKNGYTQEQINEYLASQGLIQPEKQEKENWWQRLSSTGDDLQYAIQKGVLKGLEGTLDTVVGFGSEVATGVANLFDSHENKKGGLIGQEITGKETVGDKITNWAEKFISKDLAGKYFDTNIQAYLNNPGGTLINDIRGEYKDVSDYQKTLEESYLSEGKVGEMIRGGAESIGQMLPSIVLTKVGAASILGSAVFGFGAAGNATEHALQQGASLNDAIDYGAAVGMLETAVEGISGNIGGFGSNVFQRILAKGSGKVASKLATSTVFKLATNSITEGLEEVASEIATPYLDRYILDIDTPNATAEQCLEAGIMGASIGLLMSGASLTNRQQAYLSNLEDLYSMHQNAVNSKNYEGANYIWETIEIEQGKASKYFTKEELSFSNIKHKMNVLDKLETREDFAQNSEYIGQLYESISKDLKGLDETTRNKLLKTSPLGLDFNEQGNINQDYKDMGREKKLELRNFVRNVQRIDPSVQVNLKKSGGYNASYDASTNTLTLVTDTKKNMNAVALHEFLHKVRPTSQYNQISELATEIAKKQGKYDQKINELKKRYEGVFSESSEAKNLLQKLNNNEISSQEYEKQYEEALTEYVQEEFVADYIGDTVFAGNQKAINELVGENEGLAKKILNLFNKKTQEGDKLTAEEKKYYNKIKKSFKAAIEESKAKQNPLTINEDGMTKYNIKTFESGGSEMLEKELKKKKFSKEEIEDVMAKMNRMVAITKALMKKYPIVFNSQNMEITTDENGNTYVSAWEKNGEYKYNIDLTTICKKRETFSDVLDYLISNEDLNNLNFSQENLVELNLLLQQEGIETACPLCFVDAKRYRIDSWATDITTKWNELCEKSDTELQKIIDEHNELQKQKEEKAKQEGKEIKKAKTIPYIKCCIEMIKNPELKKKINKEDLMSSDIKEFLRVSKNNLLEYYVFNAYGSGTPKPIKKYSPYNNEILDRNKTSSVIKRTTDKNGGVRLFSFSDFKVEDFFDYAQMFSNLAAKKLKLQSYTKEIAFAKMFGLTGAKINLSLIPKVMKIYNEDGSVNTEKTKENAGLDENGNLIYDENHSVDPKEAFALCKKEGYKGNVGPILVGVSNKQIIKALRDNRIAMVIPYHKSSLNPVVAALYGIDTYTDYTLFQRTRETKSNGKIAGISVNKEFEFYKDLEITQDPRTTASNYLKWCKENNYQPKFPQFIKEKNYYKLLVDFNVYDGDIYTPQQEVKLEFPKNVNKIIEGYVSQRQSQINERNEKIDSIQKRALEILKRPSTDNKKFSLKDNQGTKLTNEQAEFFKNVDPKLLDKKGRLIRFYHGTQALHLIEEAGIFLANKAYSGPMAFFTASEKLGRLYSKTKKYNYTDYMLKYLKNFEVKNGSDIYEYYDSLQENVKKEINDKIRYIDIVNKNGTYEIKKLKKPNRYIRFTNYISSNYFLQNAKAVNLILNYLNLSNDIKFDSSKIITPEVKTGVFESYINIKNGLWTETKDAQNKQKLFKLLEGMKQFSEKSMFSSEIYPKIKNSKYLNQINKNTLNSEDINELNDFIDRFEEDLKNDTKKSWVEIPDAVTVFLEMQGYDGIIDESGKFSGTLKDLVAIPFYEEQVKSVDNLNPTEDRRFRYSLKDQDVSKTKPVSPEYVTGYADANQQWKYTKKTTSQIYNDMMNSILIPSDKVKVKGGKGKILDYLFQQINKDKVATSEIADKIVDYVFDNVTVNDQNIPESFKSSLKKQFKNDLYETVFNGGKATFRTKMIERIDALKEKIEVMKQKEALKSVLKNFKKIKKLEKANFSYNPQAQNVATALNTALNYFKPTTNKLSEIFAQIQNPATRKNVESFINIVEKYNSDPNSLNKIEIPVATLDEVKKLYDIDRMGEELNSKELLAYSHLLSAINHIVNQYINSKNALSYSVAANKAQTIKQDLDSKEQVNVSKLTSIPAAIIKMPIRIKYFEGSSTGESFGLTNYVVKELQQAENKKLENIMYLKGEFDDFFKKNKKFLKRLSSEIVNINGQDLTLAQAISLYELSKRPTASRHFVLDEEPNALGINVYDKNKNLKGTLLFQENPTDIIEQKFDSTTMEYIDIVERMFNEKAKQLKIDTDNEYLGYTNVTQDLYFPSTVDKKGRPKSIAKASMAKEIEELYGQSYNQNTTEKATNKLELKPVDFVVADHIERVSSYNAFMVPVTKIDRMMNTVLDKKEGPLHSIITSKQTNFYDAIHAWVVDTVQSKQFDTESKLINFFLSTYATSTLGFNIKTGFTQLMAYPLALKFINIKNLGKGIANKKFTKQDYAQMDKYCPYVRYRNYSSDVVTQEVGAKALGTIQDIAMAHITFTDRFTIERLWIASQYQIESELGYKVGTEENLTEAGKLLETIIRDTQAVNTLEQPTVQRRAGTFSKIVLIFSKQSTQMFNSLAGSILEYRLAKQRLKANPTDAKLQELEKTSRKQLLNTITGVSASILGETLLTMAAAALLGKDDDDEKKLETFLKEMFGNTAGMIPFINQLSGLIQGYDFNISVTQSINNLASAFKSIGTYIEKNDFRGAWYQWSKAIAPFTGIPFKNINEYGLTIIGAFSPEAAYKFRSIWYNKTIAKYTEDVYKYVEKGDEEMVGTIFLEIYKEKGITIDSDDIESELIALANSGIDITKLYPKATNRVFTVEGEEYKFTLSEYKDFQKAYSKYLTENVENLIYTGKYIKLDSETQAKAIKYIQDAAYYKALQEIKPDIDSFTISKTNMLSKAVDVKYVSTVLAYGNSISGDDKKENIQKYINSLKISKTEKEILFAMFYKPDKSRTSTISNYLSSKGYTSSEVRIILKKLKYIEEEK